MIDIYFEPNYGKLYEKMEDGNSTIFEYNSEYGTVYHMFIKRSIKIRGMATGWYDLITPYGYGGPIIVEYSEGHKLDLIEEFQKSFGEYCIENNIVSEFIRFHPIIDNAKDFKDIYDVNYIRNTVGTSINLKEDPMKDEFSKSARKSVRRAIRNGVSYRIIEEPKDVNSFKEIYYSTMDRNRASDYYYFEDEYFNACLEYFRENIIFIEVLYENKVIAAAFYFVYGDIIHAHLSGTLNEYLNLSPAYIIKYATAMWAKENGIKLIHYGGGTTNKKDDSLYIFKRKFTKGTEFKFYTGKKIWNKEKYEELCKLNNIAIDTDFFPAYRGESYEI